MKVVDINNKTVINSKDLMRMFKEKKLAVRVNEKYEFDAIVAMAKEEGYELPSFFGWSPQFMGKFIHRSNAFCFGNDRLMIDSYEWCAKCGYVCMSYEAFIAMKPEVDGPSFGGTPVAFKPEIDVFEIIRKSIHQGIVDGVMNQPYDIHISSDGKTTTAKFYVNGKVVREAEAKCHPEDRFNFHTGAEVAFDRLWEKKPKELKSDEEKPKLDMFDLHVGDKVRVRKDLVVGERYNYGRSIESFVEMMDDLRGEVVTIDQVFHREDGSTEYKILEHWLWWTPQMFEEVIE